MPQPKKPAKTGKAAGATVDAEDTDDTTEVTTKPARPEVTQKGQAMIGDLRTDALHEALQNAEIDSDTLVALLVLAFAGKNVSVQSGADFAKSDREQIAATLTEGGALSRDAGLIHTAARATLTAVLSCRENMTNSGDVARIAGDSIGASLRLPNMATDEFLSCVSKTGVEKAAAAEGVPVHPRGKDTRAALVERFKDGLYVYPGALFRLTEQEIAAAERSAAHRWVPGAHQASQIGDDGTAEGTGEDGLDGDPDDETDAPAMAQAAE